MAFETTGHQLQSIAADGNYPDIMNAMALITAYSKIYTTGQVPTVRKLRGGKLASVVAGLEATLTGATRQNNSIHEFNTVKTDFYSYVAATQPGVYAAIHLDLQSRLGVAATPGFPTPVNDCQGTLLGTAVDLATYLTLWNDTKVDADFAICGTRVAYLSDSGVAGFLVESIVQPDNSKIIFNAPAVHNHVQRESFNSNRTSIVDTEAQVKPKSVATNSTDNI